MSATKAALKTVKAAIDHHNYEEAIEKANLVITADPTNYNANVFLGLAYEKLDQDEAAEVAYKTATKRKPDDPLAWQGLIVLYEKHPSEKLDQCHDVVLTLANTYMEKDDRHRCQAVLDKYTIDAQKYGSRAQLKHALEVYIPMGPLYDYLEGRIPHPAHTYSRIADIVEAEEKERINTEIGQRRTRLGAKIDQVTADVKRDVWEGSQLESLYGAIIDWTTDDDVRRRYEEKLLQRAYDQLAVLPMPRKLDKIATVQKLAEGLVILKHPYLLAWSIKLEWTDIENLEDMDFGLLREHVKLFPDEGRSKVLQGYLESDLYPFTNDQKSAQDEKNDSDEISGPISAEDRLILMSEGFEDSPSSILTHRIMAQYYLHLEEHESAAAAARQGRNRIRAEQSGFGVGLPKSENTLNIILATALVHYQAPRHHPEAHQLFQEILSRNPLESSALLGIGLILEEQERYTEATSFLSRAVERNNDPKVKSEAAWCKALNGDYETSRYELETCLSEMDGTDLRTKSLRSQTLYRIGMCIWNGDRSSSARKSRDGAYARFLSSLQADLNNGPAYTGLGIYYADYAKDRKRARKCFQKAFELSYAEIEAAHRLAQEFAKSSEWDLVEVVAQRVIDSGVVKPAPGSKKKAVSWPFAALGVVQLNSQEYFKSVVSFQSALRIAPAAYHCWVGLGESYHHCGRYIAATKALDQAQKLEVNTEDENIKDNWFSKYMLANVRRELGEYDDAIAGYRTVLKTRPNEFGVSIALLQSLVESAWHSVELGFFGRAATEARNAIGVAQSIVQSHNAAFNLWKAVGEACSVFTYVPAYAKDLPDKILKSLLETDVSLEIFDILADIDGVGQDALLSLAPDNGEINHVISAMRAALLAQKRAIHACATDHYAKAVSWYNLGWTEYRAYMCGYENSKTQLKKKPVRHLKASVQCIKRAIELESGNAEFWNSLGIVTAELNAKVSQHSFIRSLYLNDKNARVWTNIGTLYLMQDDYELANEAFTRAQSSDPDYAQAWIGQGLLANRFADPREARTLFTHAFEIADSASTMIKQQYTVSTFDHIILSAVSSQATDVLQPLFALHQLRSQLSANSAFQHLSSLYAERAGNYSDAISSLTHLISKLEAEYEDSESTVTLLRFVQAKSDLARVQLANQDLEAAAANAETAIDLSNDDGLESKQSHRVRLSAHMTAGLAYYFQETSDQAIQMFRGALEETQGDPDIVCLLAQMLWAKGSNEERNVAREQLFDCVEKHPEHVDAIMLLGTISILDNDQDTLDAVTTDLRNLRTRDYLDEKQQSKVGQLLAAIATLFPGKEGRELAEVTEAATAVMLSPQKPHGWSQLAGLNPAEDPYPAEAALLTATKEVPPRGTLNAADLAKAHVGTRRLEGAQRAVKLAPWMGFTWDAV